MRRFVCLLVALMLVCSAFGTAAFAYVPGTYTGKGQGYGPIKVTVTVDDGAITEAVIEHEETEGIGKTPIDTLVESNALVGLTSADELDALDAVSSATCTLTFGGLKDALTGAFAAANGEEAVALAFTTGTYNAAAKGYNGMSEFAVTFSDSAIESIDVVSSTETEHVCDVAFEPMIADMIAANGSGVDAVSGATFSSAALRAAVNDAAEQVGCTDMVAFKANTVVHEAGEAIEETYDIVVVGGGCCAGGSGRQHRSDHRKER